MSLPEAVTALLGQAQYPEQAAVAVDRTAISNACAAVRNANPLFWDKQLALDVTGCEIAPLTLLSSWMRPHYWMPDNEGEEQLALQAHFDMKRLLAYPDAIITENALEFGAPVAVGDSLCSYQVVQSVSELKSNRLGEGRYWVVDIVFENQDGVFVGRDRYTAFGYDSNAGGQA
jgi:acyl dehydratase